MVNVCVLVLIVASAAATAVAQQSGDGNRNYAVNYQGGGSSPVESVVPDCVQCPGFVNQYFTPDPLAPVAWFIALEGQIGWFTTPTNSVDIGPYGLAALLDGFDPTSSLSLFLKTDGNGDFTLVIVPNPALAGASAYFAMAHLAATSPDGFWISQTHHTTFAPANNLASSGYQYAGSTVLSLGDDDTTLVGIGFGFPFYGSTYTQCYVGSNGNVTFGAGDSSFLASANALRSGPRRIAGWWDDLDPGESGVVAVTTTMGLVNTMTVYYHGVPEFAGGTPGTGTNTFSIQLWMCCSPANPAVYLDYEALSSGTGVVGISPGGNVFGPAPGVALDLSLASPAALSSGTAYYEVFDVNNPKDVGGHRVGFDLNTGGQPVSQS